MKGRPHWLYRPENHRKLWMAQYAILAVALLSELFIQHHPYFAEAGFTLDATWGFYAWYGFVTCAAMVAGAKFLGLVLKRPEGYYDE